MEFVYKQSPAYLINILARLFNQALATRLAPHNATPAQLPVLLSLWQKDGQTQSELCKRMRIEQPTLANTLKRMVRDRLVRKVPDTNDRRQTRIKLTQRGRDLKPILTKSALELHTTAMQGMTEAGLETMLMMIQKIISNLDNDLRQDPLVLDETVLEAVIESPSELAENTDNDETGSVSEETVEVGDRASESETQTDALVHDESQDGDQTEDTAEDEPALILRDVDIVRD